MKAVMYPFAPAEPSVQLTNDFPELNWTVVASPEEFAAAIPGAIIYVASNRTCQPAVGKALRQHGDALRWLHVTSAGIEKAVAMGIPEGVVVTNATGVKAGMVSEHALLLLLALVRRLPMVSASQRSHQWLRAETSKTMLTLEGAVVCIIGRGAIGRELARKLRGIDARPIAVSRSAESDENVERVFSRERLHEALALADAVAICTSGDDTTQHLFGAAEFAAMKPGAVIVNVARGSIIDERALIAALRAGHVGAAGLDVAETEPMEPGNPLWDMPNVIISPHVAGQGSTGYPQQRKLFGDNLARLRAGQPLLNECKILTRA